MKLRIGDALAVLLVLLAALGGFLWLGAFEEQGNLVSIYEDGALMKTVSLSGEQQEFALNGTVISVGGEGAWFVSSDCPDQVCVHTGKLGQGNRSAACLPNRILIALSKDAAGEPDAVIG